MINVNQITSQLAKMPDQALQQYAAMHKNDPYTMALALAESNRRKELRDSVHLRAPQQPKVVDQEIAQMTPTPVMSGAGVPVTAGDGTPVMSGLPEDTGIGKLPAKNLEKMAGGGIVAFEEGGHVPRYQGVTDGSLVRQTVPQAMDFGGIGTPIYSQGAFSPQAGDAELQARIARIEANPRMRREDKDALIAQARQEFGLPKQTTIPPTTPVPMGSSAAPTTSAAPTGTSPLVKKEPGVVDQAIERKKLEDEAAAAGKKLPPEPGLPSINSYMKQFEMALPKKEEAQSEETFMNKRAEPMKEYFEKANATIQKEAARLKTDKEQDFYMSLIQGGLAAAAESGPNALQNIAKGFSVGAGSYKEALKDFRKASQENSKMEMDLMKAKAADKKGDMDAYQKHTEAVAERNAKIDQLKTSGVATLLGHSMTSSATLGAAKYNRESMSDYRNISLVNDIKKRIDAELKDDPKYKLNSALRDAEAQRRFNVELKKFPDLAQYAGLPTTGGASGASTQGWGQATVVQPAR